MFQAFDSRGKQPLGTEEVVMVRGLIKDYCKERGIDSASNEAEEAAKELLGWFQFGITDRNRLRELLHSRVN